MSSHIETCPICGEGHLQLRVDQNETEYKGHNGLISLFYSECDACGSEQADAIQTRNNKRAMLAFKKEVDGLLTGAQLKELRNRLNITQSQAAAIFGGGPVAFSKYESDDVMQSESMDKLLRLADAVPAAFTHLALQAGVAIPSGVVISLKSVPRAGGDYVSSELKPETERKAGRSLHLRVVHSTAFDESSLGYGT
ncbi:HTH-type transcriptional regulator/antitoxin MqsA [Methylobacter tundripaludum]|uniref:HTH-type transcriptional regulator/antitoxin MqsA n=1 Tax=Methylobacter tundripaludum TaxID=173365 RepID=A0A2S6HDS4_9GAMM|nr:type II toxin-antitoxin system MqsA family antitoxin [Methylobacter tundripaludum]PPK75627.1 HTH-type transcriptional regulator/antitoxin MqsA [Methylobacter tundripaludum]